MYATVCVKCGALKGRAGWSQPTEGVKMLIEDARRGLVRQMEIRNAVCPDCCGCGGKCEICKCKEDCL